MPLDVILVAVGDQDIGQVPALGVDRGKDRPRLRRVDRGCGLRCGIVQEHAEIVLETDELPDCMTHGGSDAGGMPGAILGPNAAGAMCRRL